MTRWLREPLLHFVAIGAVLFAIFYLLNPDTAHDDAGALRITEQDIHWLTQTWSRQRARPPTEDELRGIVADYLRQLLLAREALTLGLDRNDTIVQRRLAQKMEYLVQDTAAYTAAPTEAQLRAFFAEHRADYTVPERISFSQIYFRSAEAAQNALQAAGPHPPKHRGDPTLLGERYTALDQDRVAVLFGDAFANAVFDAGKNRWLGPVESGYGYHLVRIDNRLPREERSFAAIREQVENDWRLAEQRKTLQAFLAHLRHKYPIQADPAVRPLLVGLGEATP